ncbi:MAG: hypothetical protein JNM66_12750 [Bryobacterales bacterium]|nr:hypothetical protein [Bryobacterales bacterium]
MNPIGIEKRPLAPAPEKNAAYDHALALTKVLGLAFPFLGPAATLFDVITAPKRGQRLTEWFETTRVKLNELSERVDGLTPEKLAKSDAFVSAFAQATQAALKNHQQEKLEALRNAVLNAALGREDDADHQTLFLALIDRFTVLHLTILRFWNDARHYLKDYDESIPLLPNGWKMQAAHLVMKAMPKLSEGNKDLTEQVINLVLNDLEAANLLTLDRTTGSMTAPSKNTASGESELTIEATVLGKEFLAFISEPTENPL